MNRSPASSRLPRPSCSTQEPSTGGAGSGSACDLHRPDTTIVHPPPKAGRHKMLYCEAQMLFLDAARETLERIREQRRDAPDRLRPVLSYIERRLFSPRLSAAGITRACGIKDRSFSTHFGRALGLTPSRYIEQCRMEIAERMVRETDVKITWISPMLGYAGFKVFSNAFKRLTGERPLEYRKKRQGAALERTFATSRRELDRLGKLRRALAGTLERDEAEKLIGQLRSLYPPPPTHQEGSESASFMSLLW